MSAGHIDSKDLLPFGDLKSIVTLLDDFYGCLQRSEFGKLQALEDSLVNIVCEEE